ncbi:MAG: transcriptional regulator [Bacteroidetes bacterium]|nr:transcriptional regulator [Bacteroidota bacterium]
METLKYTVIKSIGQYNRYCRTMELLLITPVKSKAVKDEIELLSLLVEKWDAVHSRMNDADPVELLQALMKDRNLKSKDLVSMLGVSKGLISDILNYRKGLSKDMIRRLALEFRVSQEAFNRPYRLKWQDAKLQPSLV